MNKTCPKCELVLPFEAFAKNKAKADGRQRYCRSCKKSMDASYYSRNKKLQRHRVDENRRKLREEIDALKALKGCCVCGEKEPCCLDFHHSNDDKEGDVSQLTNSGRSRVFKEIEKCCIVCSNCHRKIHNGLLCLQGVSGSILSS